VVLVEEAEEEVVEVLCADGRDDGGGVEVPVVLSEGGRGIYK